MAGYEPCTLIVGWTDPNESKKEDIITINGRGMEASKATFRDLPVVNFRPTKRQFKEGDKLYIDWIPVGTDDWVVASSIMSVPVTIKNTRTGDYEEAEIELGGKYVFATTLVGTAGIRARICLYTVPTGMTLVLGKRRAHNSRLLLNPVDAG